MSELVFLGTGSAGYNGQGRNNPGIYYDGMLFDCGAGIDKQLEQLNLFDKVHTIYLTHLHSDHISGIVDFIVKKAINNAINRTIVPIIIIGPPGLKRLINTYIKIGSLPLSIRVACPIHITETTSIADNRIHTMELSHSLFNMGYLIDKKIFYTGDTRDISNYKLPDCEILIHEAVYLENRKDFGMLFGHSTAKQAASIAIKMGAKQLYLTHFSTADPKESLKEARNIFPDVKLAYDGMGVLI